MIYGENGDRTIFANSSAMVSVYSQEMLLLAELLTVFNTRADFWPPIQEVKGGLCLAAQSQLRLSAPVLCSVVCPRPLLGPMKSSSDLKS